MKVNRNFDQIYCKEQNPWDIGDADSDRYDLYYNLIKNHSLQRKTIFDIGCGIGAFLARFKDDFQDLSGVELCNIAIERGHKKYPFIDFTPGSADALAEVIADDSRYDTIIFSDVIYYLNEQGKNASLRWISEHLGDEGLAFIAAWCPGGKYLTYEELERLVKRYFVVEEATLLSSNHAVFITRKKYSFVAITIDYETWQPIPKGKTIDWDKDIFQSADQLIEIASDLKIPLTFMAEMGEYFWCLENLPDVAKKMQEQWKKMIKMGHDVQLHLHPSWLPELGAEFKDGHWSWNLEYSKCSAFPGDLITLIAKCKAELEMILREVDPDYQVACFRAGGYSVQPSKNLYEALTANGIACDSSVFYGGRSDERGYDFSLAYSNHQPYFANSFDFQLKAVPAEKGIVELPICTFNSGERWFFDGLEARVFAKRFFRYQDNQKTSWLSSEKFRLRRKRQAVVGRLYAIIKRVFGVNNIFPRRLGYFLTDYSGEKLTGNDYFVAIGHTKADLNFSELKSNISQLVESKSVEFMTLSKMTQVAREELSRTISPDVKTEADRQVLREWKAVLGTIHHDAQSSYLQAMIKRDSETILDLGCGSGYWTHKISQLVPWAKVCGVDVGEDFIAKARELYSTERVQFELANFEQLPFAESWFDCIYADNTLEHAYDVDKVLMETYRILKWGGQLVAAIPSDARNVRAICDNHSWKTYPAEVKIRLECAGFTNIEIEELDTYKALGTSPYPPSKDRIMYIKAWKKHCAGSKLERALEVMDWVYKKIEPGNSEHGVDEVEIILNGKALCMGYAIVVGKLLMAEGFNIKWLTMFAKGHPRGRGKEKIDSHEVVLVRLDGKEIVFDPMANIVIPYSFKEIIKNPSLAEEIIAPDSRYVERGYFMYTTSFWYSKVFKYQVRSDLTK